MSLLDAEKSVNKGQVLTKNFARAYGRKVDQLGRSSALS